MFVISQFTKKAVNRTIKKIRKRDGRVVKFEPEKITDAIFKAALAVGGKDRDTSESLATKVIKLLEESTKPDEIPTVEATQDIIEKILVENGHFKTAKSFILYRAQHKEIREFKKMLTDTSMIESYLNESDWRVRENSNMTYSLQGLNSHISSKIISRYWLQKIYPPEIRKAHANGEFHIHDLGVFGAYCVGWDIKDLLIHGFQGVRGKVESKPPKHLRVALGQIINFFYTLQGESAGAQAFSNFDSYLAPFIRYDKVDYKQVKQSMQEFMFNINVPTRVGFQTPFTNITLDLTIPGHMKDEPVIIGGKPQKEVYGDFQEELDMINTAFAEVMLEGDASGRVFTFPIPTYNITKDFDWDNENYKPIWEMTAKYGIPYFANFINSDMSPDDVRSMCCRLRIDNRELRKRGGGLFGANPLTGSIGVVTINMPRVGYLAKNEEDFFKKLAQKMDLAQESLEIKRKIIESFMERGLYPYSKFYLRNTKKSEGQYWKNHFSTIGLVGMNEALLNLLSVTIADDKGKEFAIKVLDFMRDRLANYQESTGHIYNLEATPAESTSYRLARGDKKEFPKIITANEQKVKKGAPPYYTNSTQLPVGFTHDIHTALKLQDDIQTRYTGGTVLHGFLGERMPSGEAVKKLVKAIATNFRLPYFTITPTFSICPVHGYLSGEHEFCPVCDET